MRILTSLIVAASAAALSACASGVSGNGLPKLTSTLDKISAAATPYRILFRFSLASGATPETLVAFRNDFYGVTSEGGAHNDGTVFALDAEGRERVLYSFGTNGGRTDGNFATNLTQYNGRFYGTTYGGGRHNLGTVFSVTPSGMERVVYSFASHAGDGTQPVGGLFAFDGNLFGTTRSGGAHGVGTIFRVTPDGREAVLHSFSGYQDGALPEAAMVALDGTLYGTTTGGGRHPGGPLTRFPVSRYRGCGTLFAIDPSGDGYRVLYRFRGGDDGCGPGGLTPVRGALYGTTGSGGGCTLSFGSCGTIFAASPAGTERVIFGFGGRDGYFPGGALVAAGNTLYGTTGAGGGAGGERYCGLPLKGCGAVFSLHLDGSNERVIYGFHGDKDGASPGGLIYRDGWLYGTTSDGGTGSRSCGETMYGPSGCGTFYRVAP